MDQGHDEWLQDGPFKTAGYAKPGESAAALIRRYRAEMIRRPETDPKQAHKKEWVEASADLALAIDKLWAKHQPAGGGKLPLEKQQGARASRPWRKRTTALSFGIIDGAGHK